MTAWHNDTLLSSFCDRIWHSLVTALLQLYEAAVTRTFPAHVLKRAPHAFARPGCPVL